MSPFDYKSTDTCSHIVDAISKLRWNWNFILSQCMNRRNTEIKQQRYISNHLKTERLNSRKLMQIDVIIDNYRDWLRRRVSNRAHVRAAGWLFSSNVSYLTSTPPVWLPFSRPVPNITSYISILPSAHACPMRRRPGHTQWSRHTTAWGNHDRKGHHEFF